MDVAYNQHSPHSRHHSRSSTNLNHLTLAPLTSRLPITDSDDLLETHHSSLSYIEGRSAPTTPSILSRSSSRVSLRKPPHIILPKSKSSTQLIAAKQPRHAPSTPGGTKLRHAVMRDELTISSLSAKDRNDSDWLLRASASITTSTRESKGQAWLVSRASSTSLTGQRDEDDEEFERTLAREREQTSGRGSSRRGSAATIDADDEFSPVTTRRSLSFGPPTGVRSRPMSRFNSQNNSRRGSRAQLFTPLGGEREGYFDQRDLDQAEFLAEPDFVNNEEEVYENQGDFKDDEDIVRKLARANNIGLGGWVERMLGWSLFAVEEDGEEGGETEIDDKGEGSDISSKRGGGFDGAVDQVIPDMPPLKDDQTGGWQDAAWLLSVATKVLL